MSRLPDVISTRIAAYLHIDDRVRLLRASLGPHVASATAQVGLPCISSSSLASGFRGANFDTSTLGNAELRNLPILRDLPTLSRCFQGLRVLELAESASDEQLLCLGRECKLPRLEVLSCKRAAEISDVGLVAFTQAIYSRELDGAAPFSSLSELDITLCQNTTYGATIEMRRHLPRLAIRRIPKFMQGAFETPFASAGAGSIGGTDKEVHYYYCDGSFWFDRASEARGYAIRTDQQGNFFTDSLQFIDLEQQFLGMLPLAYMFYRPGVALRKLEIPGCSPGEERVMVCQLLHGMKAPSDIPPLQDLEQLQVGHSAHYRRDGSLIGPAPGQLPYDPEAHLLVSHMRKTEMDDSMPPASLTEEIEAFERRKAHDISEFVTHPVHGTARQVYLERLEDRIHHAMGGE